MTPSATLASFACLAVPVITLGYAALCYLSPFKPCPRCQATGLRRAALGRKRLCNRCRTTGRIPRVGIRIYNHLRRFSHDLNKEAR